MSAAHLVICGFGPLGAATARASLAKLAASDIFVIDQDHSRAEVARMRGFRSICGDARLAHTQRVAQVGTARDIIICIDSKDNEEVLRLARSLCETANIQVAIAHPSRAAALREAGADYVLVLSDLAGEMLAISALT